MAINPLPSTINKTNKVIPDSTKVVRDSITINKQSAFYFCITVMLKLSESTTEYSKSIIAVLEDNTVVQQQRVKELINLPLLKVPDLQKKAGTDDEYTNQNEIQSYQSSNQQISANRQMIQQELSSAQQRAQANQKAANSTTTESMQILQATSSMLSTLKELTIKANLTTSPSD
ncbi:CT847 family type III secretion system effector [Candidatus Chlamydia corallus]|uniref:CT847 family type III secretion system effector n=1 Tax=Candidatus Chlamydia corallus TaxID=2038470 RepID=UPI000C2FE327|nr:CT847 family type III secretion system effector [Candidatus Chlamydia corallus]